MLHGDLLFQFQERAPFSALRAGSPRRAEQGEVETVFRRLRLGGRVFRRNGRNDGGRTGIGREVKPRHIV